MNVKWLKAVIFSFLWLVKSFSKKNGMGFKQKLGSYARIKPENSQTITFFSADIPLKVPFSMNKTESL